MKSVSLYISGWLDVEPKQISLSRPDGTEVLAGFYAAEELIEKLKTGEFIVNFEKTFAQATDHEISVVEAEWRDK